ncbi:CARDB domain-containing protein [Haladaptatus sp. GCM10025707]|uniref:COG1361 S-layer family protein n=1 Tax=unclassified Haladaptatus TaxID=2622732 RepID=UPI0023E77073|nr:CARDB domain-containing protein [Haladaptatus sp. QDMS2]
MRRAAAVGLVLLLVGSALGATGLGAATTLQPGFSAYAPDNTVQPGSQTSLGVQLVNSATSGAGNASGTARNVRVSLDENGAPIDVKTGTIPLGSVPNGATIPATFAITVDEDAKPGTYDVDVDVRYEYTNADGETVTRTARPEIEVEVADGARFQVNDVRSDVSVGERGDVTFDLENVGDEVTSAVVEVQSGSPTIAFGNSASASRYVGEWGDDETKQVSFEGMATPDAETRPLPLYVTVTYETEDGITQTSQKLTTSVTPAGKQTAQLTDVSSRLFVGEKGTLTATVTNRGPNPLHDATIAMQPNGETVVPVEPSQPLGTLDVGESATIEYPIRVAESAEPGPRQFSFVVNYQNADDELRQTAPLTTRVTVGDEQDFSLDSVVANLRVDTEGRVQGTLVNDGPVGVENAVVVLQPIGTGISTQSPEYAVGSLEAGGEASFSFPVSVSEGSEAGPRQFSVVVQYQNADGEQRKSRTLSEQVTVAGQRDVFSVEPVNTSLAAGSSDSVTLRLSNNGDENLTNINAKAFVDDPISADSDESYVPSLAAGESTTVEFELSATEDADERAYPLKLDFQYDEPDGDTRLSDTYQVPIRLTAATDDGGVSMTLIGGVAVVLLGAIGFAYTRYR